ncbi:hypothetical protein [Lysobacter sp. A3-1-A15]|uniref:hypothetical protein n=1 Tax=Novilysobacter viscosus TaxID=3098602 RepID=UPI002ED828B0
MNRKLQNTISALMTSGALLVLGLVASSQAMPLMPSPSYGAALPMLPETAGLDALPGSPALEHLGTAAALASALEPTTGVANGDALVERPTRTPSRRRQALAMPYFSFAPRG